MNDSTDIHKTMLEYCESSRNVFAKRLTDAETLDFQGGVMAGPTKTDEASVMYFPKTITEDETIMMAKKIDTHLEEKLFKHLDKLRKKIDWIGDRELRQKLDDHATAIYKIIKEATESSGNDK
jgi:hypothetical protein